MPPPLIALLTDFGLTDIYVGVMKAVLWRIAPGATILDLTHRIPARDVAVGAYALAAACPHLRDGTIVVGVVDPGVGSARRAIAVETDRLVFVGPDNGLFTLALRRERPLDAVALNRREFWNRDVDPTFHGRDVFAPAAAHLANGLSLGAVGTSIPLNSLVWAELPDPEIQGDLLRTRVLHVDSFGNIITNAGADQLALMGIAPGCSLMVRAFSARFARAYADVSSGELLAYIGSSGHLEIAVRDGQAARQLGVRPGEDLPLRKLPDETAGETSAEG